MSAPAWNSKVTPLVLPSKTARAWRLAIHPITLSALLASIIIIALLAYSSFREPIEIGADNCIRGRPWGGVIDLVIDKSDTLSDAQVANLRGLSQEILDRMETNEKINVYVLKSNSSALAPELKLSLCKLSDGSKGRDSNILTSNPAMIRVEFEAHFADELRRIIIEEINSAATDKADKSAIIETIEFLASQGDFNNTSLYDAEGRMVGKARLILFSDMLQHMPGSIDHYKHNWRTKPPHWGDRNNRMSVLPRLHGVEVEIYYLPREKDKNGKELPIQGAAHRDYWRDFFMDAGALKVTFRTQPAPLAANDARWRALERAKR